MTISVVHPGTLVSCLLVSTTLLISAGAFAQSSPGANPPAPVPNADPGAAPNVSPSTVTQAPKIQLVDQAPPPPSPVVRTDKTHDGFYTRLNLGFGSQSTSIDADPAISNFTGTRGSLDLGLLIGGAPSPG